MEPDLNSPGLLASTFHPGASLCHPSPDPGGATIASTGDIPAGYFFDSEQQFNNVYNGVLPRSSSSTSFPIPARSHLADAPGFPMFTELYIMSSDTIQQPGQYLPDAWSPITREDLFSTVLSSFHGDNNDSFESLRTAHGCQHNQEIDWQRSHVPNYIHQLPSPAETESKTGDGPSSLDTMGISHHYPSAGYAIPAPLNLPPMVSSISSPSSTSNDSTNVESPLHDLPAFEQTYPVDPASKAELYAVCGNAEQDTTSNESTASSLSSPVESPQSLIFAPISTPSRPRRRAAKTGQQASEATAASPIEHPCDHPGCSLVFSKRFEKKKHMNIKHSLRYNCPVSVCNRLFGVRRDCERHIADKHPDLSPQEQMFCPVDGCKRSRVGFKKTRKDNLLRHMRKVHKWQEAQVREAFRV